jgi:glycolate oxidase
MGLPKTILSRVEKIVGRESVLTADTDLRTYAYDATSNWYGMPEVVVFPTTTDQVAEVMHLASGNGIPVTVRGAGTCLSGGPIPICGGIVLCTTRMNRIVDIDKDNFTVLVEAGVVLNDLNQVLSQQGLFFPPDPQSFLAATIGGCIAENSSGPYAVKYGVFRHYLLGMTAVLPNGTVLKLGGRTMKNVTGYDLPQLICGSEGTLAVVTRVMLRLLSLPESRQTVLATFGNIRSAGEAVAKIRSAGVVPAKIELIDNWILHRVEERVPLGLPLTAEVVLLFELDGVPETVRQESEQVTTLCRACGADVVRPARDAKEADNFWTARRAGFSAIFGNAPTVLAEDVTVPVSRIPDLVDRINQIGKENDVTIVMIGHAGDGNLHPSVLTDKADTAHYARAQKAVDAIFKAALGYGGAISGEHGIGLEKKKYLKEAMSPGEIDLLKQLKSVFDPKGILNPGKIWE